MSIQSILEKLTKEEIKELSKSLNEMNKKHLGNPLSLRKQEQFMADLFSTKNWQTLIGMKEPKPYNPNSKCHKTIIQLEVFSDTHLNNHSVNYPTTV